MEIVRIIAFIVYGVLCFILGFRMRIHYEDRQNRIRKKEDRDKDLH